MAEDELLFQQRFDLIRGQCQGHVHWESRPLPPLKRQFAPGQVRFGTTRAQTRVGRLRKVFGAGQGGGGPSSCTIRPTEMGTWLGPYGNVLPCPPPAPWPQLALVRALVPPGEKLTWAEELSKNKP